MSEKGYFHSEHGYWQTTGEPDASILAKYPEGTVEVPLKPTANSKWDNKNNAWAETAMTFKRQDVSGEAETLINQGAFINGVQFRCDVDSISRLEGLVRGFERGAVGPEGKTYKTSAGMDITFTAKAQVQVVLDAADDYRDWILERSAQIQNMEPIPDPRDPGLWVKQ